MRSALTFVCSACVCLFGFLSHGLAAEDQSKEGSPPVIAIQSRRYYLSNEVTAQAGYLPLDSFTKYFSVGGTFTHFYSDFIGWEIANIQYATSVSTGLVQQLQSQFGATSEPFQVLNYYGTTNIVYTPLYTKNLLFEKNVVNGEISFVLGFGIAKFDVGNINTVDFGVIFRYLLGKYTSLKFDFRNYIYLAGQTSNNLTLIAGFAYNLGEDPDKVNKKDEE